MNITEVLDEIIDVGEWEPLFKNKDTKQFIPKVESTNHGFAGELLVQSNLITKGFVPFMTNMANSEVDLLALKNNQVYKIQVKTSYCNERGSMTTDIRKTNRKHGNYTKDSFDVLAIVDIEKGKVAYFDWKNIFPKTQLTLRTNTYVHDINQNFGSKGFMIFDDYLDFPNKF